MVFDNMGRNPHICNINQNNYIMRTKLDNLRLEVKEGIVGTPNKDLSQAL